MIRIVIHVARYIPRCGNYLVLVLLILTAAEDVFGQPATSIKIITDSVVAPYNGVIGRVIESYITYIMILGAILQLIGG
jgi:hypothetical protein